MAKILVVDDELGIRELLYEILDDEGHSVYLAENAQQARQLRLELTPDLVLLDIWMPDTDGVTLLKEWGATGQLTMPVIMMSGHASVETAVEATKHGALSFLEKPITLQKLLKSVDLGLHPNKTRPLVGQNAYATTSTPSHQQFHSGDTNTAAANFKPQTLQSTSPTISPPVQAGFNFDQSLREARQEFESAYFKYHLNNENGSMTRVSEKTGLERTHLYRKLKQLGLDLGKKRFGID